MSPFASVRTIRLLVLSLLLIALGVGIALLFFTHTGHQILHEPRLVGQHVSSWVDAHPVQALLVFFALYLALTLIALPLWWLQVLAGNALGLLWGAFWCQLACTVAATLTFCFSRWLAGEWFHSRVESKMEKLRRLDERLGHNGFLVVTAVRLVHVMPFALSNYAFGLTHITAIDVALGTLLGNIPGVTLYVTIGADPKLMETGQYWAGIVAINFLLLIPIALRYLKPKWFKKIGVE